jgi:aryl-alcohol dehydrogenase-like predicted oxidoreductase/adenylate kinase family enzyme
MTGAAWLDASELRIGLGCMRLSPERFAETVAAALDVGITVFDTARAYGESERLLGDALRAAGAGAARIVTKGGMGETWIPDGRAKTVLGDCEASLRALGGLPIDTYLVHAPDPRTSWPTTVRALARLLDEGMVARVGVSNVNRRQLDEALELAPIAAIEVALSVHDDRAVRGGLVKRCEELGVALIAHSPLGGPRRAPSLDRRAELREAARAHGATPAEIALARLLALAPGVVAIPGATRPETARSIARAARLALPAEDVSSPRPARPERSDREVVLVMGIPGAGKSRLAQDYVSRGYARLNRDVRGGSLPQLAQALDAELEAGARRLVLDNTYLTRASRSYVLHAASAHGVPVRCLWLDTPLPQAQVNLVQRLLEQFGRLPMPEELRGRAQGVLSPTSQMRTSRELEPPGEDEGFSAIEVVPFVRAPSGGRAGVFVAAAALADAGFETPAPDAPHLVFDWRPGAAEDVLDPLVKRLNGAVTGAICPHGAGPPTCWCRPPLPGLPLAFARAHDVDPSRSVVIGTSRAHRTLAAALGAGYVAGA